MKKYCRDNYGRYLVIEIELPIHSINYQLVWNADIVFIRSKDKFEITKNRYGQSGKTFKAEELLNMVKNKLSIEHYNEFRNVLIPRQKRIEEILGE